MILVLWDIDGTLVHTLGAGVRGMNAAFGQLHGHPEALEGVPVAGRTDRSIVSDAFRKLGIEPTGEKIHGLRDAYFDQLKVELTRPAAAEFGVLPGVHALLDALDARADVTVALLTGNFIGGAEIKLTHFDLWHRFAFGAYGDDHLDRRDLVPVALERAREAGLSPARVIVIGDTPLDVDCAHAHGALAVGVATGPYTMDVLRHAGADLTVPSLATLEGETAWVDALGRQARPDLGTAN
jgi:phosphoglycolate phosphatase-like HAD superfamily hydrolase